MAGKTHFSEDYARLLYHYLETMEIPLRISGTDYAICRIDPHRTQISHGSTVLGVQERRIQFMYELPMPHPLEDETALLRALNEINGLFFSSATALYGRVYRDWRVRIHGTVYMDGCTRQAASRAASDVAFLLYNTRRALEILRGHLPDLFEGDALEKAEEQDCANMRELTSRYGAQDSQ